MLHKVMVIPPNSTEYCGKVEQHDYELFLDLNDIEHIKTKVRSLQPNGIFDTLSQNYFVSILSSDFPITVHNHLL